MRNLSGFFILGFFIFVIVAYIGFWSFKSYVNSVCPDFLKIDKVYFMGQIQSDAWFVSKDLNKAKDGVNIDLGSCSKGHSTGENINYGYCRRGEYRSGKILDADGNIQKEVIYGFNIVFNLSSVKQVSTSEYSYDVISIKC